MISLTSDIISNGPFLLEDSLKDIFLRKGFNSSEVMLGIQPYPGQRYKSTALEWGETPAFTGLLTGDARSRWMYFVNADWLPDAFNEVTKYYAGKDPSNPRPTPLNENCYAFRLTEAYLLKSEAIVLSGGSGTTAKSLLSIVLAHSGAGLQQLAAVDSAATQEALQLEIVKENLRNFLFENGVDWLALRRLPFAAIQRINPNIKDPNRLILPIPAAELNYNPIIQNPGY
ncbi:RagB/SusD family nutrient uptake outer membrane protein [Puia sp. P3]|uniref:RagB/SusD family nutrient uptake outer membrane protein n=1 Tax=Puia sp. P3 TaxID=3423952 RepID=UPI003D6786B7